MTRKRDKPPQRSSLFLRCPFLITKQQAAWLEERSTDLGITKNELLRRILDESRTFAGAAAPSRPAV